MGKVFTMDVRHILTQAGSKAISTGKTPVRYIRQIVISLAGMNVSIRTKILFSLCIVILLMGTTNAVIMLQMLNYSRQYDAIITNITTANSISGHIKTDIDTEMWKIVAGKTDFRSGKQYEIIGDVDTKLRWMMANTDSPKARMKLEGIRRTMQTLTQNVDLMGEQIRHNSTAAENEAALENVRF